MTHSTAAFLSLHSARGPCKIEYGLHVTNMADTRATRVIRNQFARIQRKPIDYMRFHMCEDNVRIWYALMTDLSGDKGEFAGGEYLIRMELPDDYPYKPPTFYFLTPQGLYGVNTKVCVSIGEFHSDAYPAVLGIDGFCAQLVSGLVAWREMTAGISILTTTEADKKRLARESREYNDTHHSDLVRLFRTDSVETAIESEVPPPTAR